MALSDRELRLLAEMEQALSADDPGLVSTLTGARRRGPGAAIGVATLIIGIATLFGGLIAQATLVGVAGFVIALVGVIILINALTSLAKGARPAGSTNGARRKGFGKGFTKGLEDRWDQRNNG
ncbi:MAG: hypothetical protein RL201_194 [Actinomycetota bacterium]|jgi:hypothetical protein